MNQLTQKLKIIISGAFVLFLLNQPILAKTVETDRFIYYLDNPNMLNQAQVVLEKVNLKLVAIFGDTLRYRPEVYIVGDLNQFNRMTENMAPDWGAAVAIPYLQRMVLKSPEKFNLNKSLEELLAHEYTHLFLADRIGFGELPRWFNEGMAMYMSSEWGWSNNIAMSKAGAFGQLIPLYGIEKINSFNEGKAQVAYAQSYLAVQFMLEHYSDKAADIFVKELALGRTIDEAIYQATGSTLKEFEADYKIYLNQRFNWVSLFMDTIFFWLFLAVIVVIGFWIKFRKRREYYKKWEEDEKLHSTDFDYGDSDNPEQIDDDDEAWRS